MARRPNPYALIVAGTVAVATLALGSPAGAILPPAPIDYNWDSWGDVVVGQPHRTVGGLTNAGAVSVVYGGAAGLTTSGSLYIDQNTVGVPGTPHGHGEFGHAIASGNFDSAPGYADVAISALAAPDIGGSVVVLYGGGNGLHVGAATQAKAEWLLPGAFYQTSTSVFGQSLATARFNADDYGDLVVGINDHVSGGRLLVLPGSSNGLLPSAGWYLISQQSLGLPSEAGAGLGMEQTVGDFNGDGRPDLAAGMPYRDLNGLQNPGEVVVLLTGRDGVIGSAGVVVINKNSPGVAGTPGAQDLMGMNLAAGDITGDGIDELAVGVPGTKSVLVLPGTPNGPTGIGSIGFTGQFYGDIAVLDTDGNPYKELAIGLSAAGLLAPAGSGAVLVLPGTPAGPNPSGTVWSQNTTGISDSAESNDHFGEHLLGRQDKYGGLEDLIVGAPDEDLLFCNDCGVIHQLRAGPGGLTATGTVYITALGVAGGFAAGERFGGGLG